MMNPTPTLKILGYLSVLPTLLVIFFSWMAAAPMVLIFLPVVLIVHLLIWYPAISAFKTAPGLSWLAWPLLSPMVGSTLLSIPYLLGGLETFCEIWVMFTTYAYLLWMVNVPVSLVSAWIVHHHTRNESFTHEASMTTPLDALRHSKVPHPPSS